MKLSRRLVRDLYDFLSDAELAKLASMKRNIDKKKKEYQDFQAKCRKDHIYFTTEEIKKFQRFLELDRFLRTIGKLQMELDNERLRMLKK